MAPERIRINDLPSNTARDLTADDLNKITGGSLNFTKITYTAVKTADGKQFVGDSFSGVEREMKESGGY